MVGTHERVTSILEVRYLILLSVVHDDRGYCNGSVDKRAGDGTSKRK